MILVRTTIRRASCPRRCFTFAASLASFKNQSRCSRSNFDQHNKMVEASEPTAGPSSTSPKEDPPKFPDGRPIPEGYLLHTESTTSILLPTSSLGSTKLKSTTSEKEQKDVFLNPVQEYNRDLSIVAIRTWSEIFAREKSEIWDSKRKKRGGKGKKRGREPAEQRGQAEDVNGHDAREVEVTGEQGKDDALVGDQGPHKKRKLDLGEEPAVPEVEVDLSVVREIICVPMLELEVLTWTCIVDLVNMSFSKRSRNCKGRNVKSTYRLPVKLLQPVNLQTLLDLRYIHTFPVFED